MYMCVLCCMGTTLAHNDVSSVTWARPWCRMFVCVLNCVLCLTWAWPWCRMFAMLCVIYDCVSMISVFHESQRWRSCVLLIIICVSVMLSSRSSNCCALCRSLSSFVTAIDDDCKSSMYDYSTHVLLPLLCSLSVLGSLPQCSDVGQHPPLSSSIVNLSSVSCVLCASFQTRCLWVCNLEV
jgi:hypothetical protein